MSTRAGLACLVAGGRADRGARRSATGLGWWNGNALRRRRAPAAPRRQHLARAEPDVLRRRADGGGRRRHRPRPPSRRRASASRRASRPYVETGPADGQPEPAPAARRRCATATRSSASRTPASRSASRYVLELPPVVVTAGGHASRWQRPRPGRRPSSPRGLQPSDVGDHALPPAATPAGADLRGLARSPGRRAHRWPRRCSRSRRSPCSASSSCGSPSAGDGGPASSLTPLEAALAYTRDAASRPDPADRRKALGLLAETLDSEGVAALAGHGRRRRLVGGAADARPGARARRRGRERGEGRA